MGPHQAAEAGGRELHWADKVLPSLGVLQVVQLIIPQWGHILLALKPLQPGTPLQFCVGDHLKLPCGLQLHMPSLS